jgi:hypothetical protein
MFVRRNLTFHGAFRLSFDQILKLKCEGIHKTKHYDSICPALRFANTAFMSLEKAHEET